MLLFLSKFSVEFGEIFIAAVRLDKALLFGRERAVLHLVHVSAERIHHALTDIVELLGELGREVHVHAEHVLIDQHLSVTACARADADGRDGQLFRDERRQLGRYALEHDRKCTGLLYGEGILEQPLCRLPVP